MASNPRRKSDAARRANQVIRSRTVLVMLLLGIVTFAVLFWKLYDIQIRQHSVLQEKAIEQQTRSAVVNASRGTVYDRNLNTLAISATAEDVNISPMRIAEFVESQKEKQEKAAKKAADKGETYTAPILRDQAYIAKGLSRILGVEQEHSGNRMDQDELPVTRFGRKKRTDQTISDEVRRFINGEIDPDGNEVPKIGSGKAPRRLAPADPPSGTICTDHWLPAFWALSTPTAWAAWVWRPSMTIPLPALPGIPSVPETPPARN